MDLPTIILSVCGFAVAGYVRVIQNELASVKHDLKNTNHVLNTMRELIPSKYATNEALRDVMRDVRETLQRIEDKIDQKADK